MNASAPIPLTNGDLVTLYMAVSERAKSFQEQGQPDMAAKLDALSLRIARMQKCGVSAQIVEVQA